MSRELQDRADRVVEELKEALTQIGNELVKMRKHHRDIDL